MKFILKGLWILLPLTMFLITGCAENMPQNIPQSYTTQDSYAFDASYKNVWKETLRTLSENERIKTIDKESGLIVTEYLTVDKKVLNMFQTALFGRTYKNSYSVYVSSESSAVTKVEIQSNLQMEQFGFYNRERRVEKFEAFMRQDLFSRICNRVYNDQKRCGKLFPLYVESRSNIETSPVLNEKQTISNKREDLVATTSIDWEEISYIQKRLNELGYDSGPVDGIMGSRTRMALKAFQRDYILQVTGEADSETYEMIQSL